MKLLQESPVEFLEPLSRPPEKVYVAEIDCGIDTVVLAGTENSIVRAGLNIPLPYFIDRIASEWESEVIMDDAPLRDTSESIKAFFAGKPVMFKTTVQPVKLSPFTLEVHRIIARIPYGGLMSYGDIAVMTGRPGAARAVGTACGKNPVLLIVPCHRVVGAHGPGGFGSGGIDMKRRLLRLEGTEI